jgi:hypothetical protein
MGSAEYLRVNGAIVVTWRSQPQDRVSLAELRRDHPKLASQYLRRVDSRPFVVLARVSKQARDNAKRRLPATFRRRGKVRST